MAVSFTQGNDFIVPTEDGQNYLGGAGNDTYMLSDATIAANSTIVIQDTEGTNTIQLVGGLSIASSIVTSNALELTLSNGAKVQILGANSFGYDVGGNALAGVDGTDQTFTELVENTLGTTVPATGSSTGGAVEVPDSTAPATPTFSVSAAAASVTEGGDAVFTVSLSAAQATASTVAYTLAGTGGAVLGTDTTTVADATLTFAAGEVSKTVTVPVTFDSAVETGEGMTLTLSAPSTGTALAATPSAAVAFVDPVVPTFTLTSNAVAGQATEEGNVITYTITPSSITDKAYTFTLSSGASTAAVTGATAADATDFTPASTTVTFAAGATAAQTVAQTVFADGVSEGLQSYSTVLLDSSLATVATLTGLISDATGGTATGSTFSLTTGADVLSPNSTTAAFKTTSGGDTIYALTDQSFTSADIIDAGTGEDVLIAAYSTAATLAPVLTSVESVTLRQSGNVGTSFDASTTTGLTRLNFDAISETTGVTAQSATNLGAGVALGISNITSDDADTFAFTYTDAAVAGTADAATLNLTAVTGATTGVVTIQGTTSTATGAGFETLNIVTTGTGSAAASTLASVTVQNTTVGAASSLKTLNVSGTSNLAITGSLDFAGTTGGTIAATGMSGDLTLTATTGNEPITFTGGTGKNTITTGSGNDSLTGGTNSDTFTIGAGNDTVVGGAGDDRVVLTAITELTSTDSISLGEGTRDTLAIGTFTAVDSTNFTTANKALIAGVSGLEVIELTANNTTAVDFSAIAQDVVRLSGTQAVDLAVTNVTTNDTLILNGDYTGATGDAGITVSGVLPNQTLALELFGTGIDLTNVGTATSDDTIELTSNISTLKIDSSKSATDTATTVNTITGKDDSAAGAYAIDNISAQNFVITGNHDLTISDAGTGDAAFSAGADINAETFTGKLVITTSLQADVIKGGTGNDTITALAGNDSINLSAGGNDTVIFSAAAASANGIDTITGFNGNGTAAGDLLNLDALTGTAIGTANNSSALSTAFTFVDDDAYVFSTNGTAASLLTGGVKTLASTDFTAATLTNVAAFLEESFSVASGDKGAFVINYTAAGSTSSYVYSFTESTANPTTIDANELTLVGVIDRGTTVIDAADIV